MPLWSKKRWYPLQCDFSAMLSPSMFEEFVKPALQKEAIFLGRSIYHLDGPGEIPHLDHILEIKKIDGIQWVAGAGQPDESDERWYPMYDRILKAGKKLILLQFDNSWLERLYSTFSPKNIYVRTICKCQDEAEELLRQAEKWA